METGNNSGGAVRHVFSVKDESLETNLEENLHLSLQSGDNSLSYALLNIAQNKYLALESFVCSGLSEAELLLQLKKSDWFKYVSSVSFAFITDKITLVPEPLFDLKSKDNFSKINFETSAEALVLSSKIRSAGCYSVFALPVEKAELYKKIFPGIKIIDCGTPLIESVLQRDKNEIVERAILNIRAKTFELVVSKGASLLFYNSFSYLANDDIIYYLLFAFEQLKQNPETIDLHLVGEVEKTDELYSIINRYVRNVKFISRNPRFEYSYRFNEIPTHAFYSLFGQYLCE